MDKNKILEINNFTLSFKLNNKDVKAVDDISLFVEKGEIVGLVGESGCGKSLTALSIVNLQPSASKVVSGEINILGENVLNYNRKQWDQKRGLCFSIIFQEPMTALDPLVRVGRQVAEVVIQHGGSKKDAKERVLEMLKLVDLKNPSQVYDNYPHQLSGGMRQRVMIALALINNPSLLVADEPTTALDVTVQKQVLNILKEMNKKFGTAILFISHDLSVVKNLCNRIYVMYAGIIVESGNSLSLIENPIHPYTKGLIGSIPSLAKKGKPLNAIGGRVPTLSMRSDECCPFYPRCYLREDICKTVPLTKQKVGNRMVSCHMVSLKKELNSERNS